MVNRSSSSTTCSSKQRGKYFIQSDYLTNLNNWNRWKVNSLLRNMMSLSNLPLRNWKPFSLHSIRPCLILTTLFFNQNSKKLKEQYLTPSNLNSIDNKSLINYFQSRSKGLVLKYLSLKKDISLSLFLRDNLLGKRENWL